MNEYRVLSKGSADALEAEINKLCAEGWSVLHDTYQAGISASGGGFVYYVYSIVMYRYT